MEDILSILMICTPGIVLYSITYLFTRYYEILIGDHWYGFPNTLIIILGGLFISVAALVQGFARLCV